MPRTAMKAPAKVRLLDELALGAVMSVCPRAVVQRTLEKTGTTSVRERLLPSELVMYLVIVLALYPEVSIREGLRIVLEELRQVYGRVAVPVAVKSAITKARKRLGQAPLREMFGEVVGVLGEPTDPGCFYRGRRVVAVDGSHLDVPDTPANRARFGLPRNNLGEGNYPLFKWVALCECGTGVVFGVRTGRMNECEKGLLDQLRPQLEPGMLLLADRYYYSYDLWRKCLGRGCDLLWRLKKDFVVRRPRPLPDGSWLVDLQPSDKLIRKGVAVKGERTVARLLEYTVEFADGTASEEVRLLTSILDHEAAPAEELSREYCGRWKAETGFDELKIHLKGSGRVLRSQLPELVEQEFYGFLLAFFVIRKVMLDAARKAGRPCRDISFVHTVRLIRRQLLFPPSAGGADVPPVDE
jgi:hypothetical protein